MRLLSAALCLLLGSGLVVLELLLPGFGLPGISGIVLLCAGTVFLGKALGTAAALFAAVCLLVLLGIAAYLILRSAAKGKLSRSRLFLKARDLADEESDLEEEEEPVVGQRGTATSALRPAGIADFDGVRMNVITSGEFLPAGTAVVALRRDGNRLVVQAVEPSTNEKG